DIVECGCNSGESRLQIFEDPDGLRAKVAGADNLAVLVEGNLAGDVDRPARPGLDDVSVSRRLCQLGWVDVRVVFHVSSLSEIGAAKAASLLSRRAAAECSPGRQPGVGVVLPMS